MAAFGVIVLVIVTVVAVTVVSQGGDPVALQLPGFDIDTSAAGVFGMGAGSLLLGLLGTFLVVGGARRGHRRRKEVKHLRREVSHPGSSGAGRTATDATRAPDPSTPGTPHPSAAPRAPDPPEAPGRSGPERGAQAGPDRAQRWGRRGRDDGEEHFSAVPRD